MVLSNAHMRPVASAIYALNDEKYGMFFGQYGARRAWWLAL